jgi:protein-S-isoprenylcysteine O-methyltransferase Ste14
VIVLPPFLHGGAFVVMLLLRWPWARPIPGGVVLRVQAVMHWGVIRREERYLERKFGEPHREYCSRVRRYL